VVKHRNESRSPRQQGLDDVDVAQAFSRVADMPQMRALRSLVIRRAVGFVRTGEAADLGCGAGHLALDLAARAPHMRITGVDISESMIAIARAKASASGLGSRVCFKRGDVRVLPFLDGSLDLVVSSLSLHHWRRPAAVLDEIDRVLRRPDPLRHKPGGAFVVFDLRRDLDWPARALLRFATQVVVPRVLREMHEPMASSEAAYTPQEAVQLLGTSRLSGWRVDCGPLWLTIAGRITGEACGVHVQPALDAASTLGRVRLARGAEQWTG
jgi:ubiquinone/menaquinone biosynthesis C-methylase UbiE